MKEHILMNQHMGGDNELLEIKECITIKTLKPTLNDNATSTELFLFNWLIILKLHSIIILTKIICVICYVSWKCIQWYTNVSHFSIKYYYYCHYYYYFINVAFCTGRYRFLTLNQIITNDQRFMGLLSISYVFKNLYLPFTFFFAFTSSRPFFPSPFLQRARILMVSNSRLETKGSRFESGC